MGSPNLLDDQDSLFGPKLKILAMKTKLERLRSHKSSLQNIRIKRNINLVQWDAT